jgi:hypothetical protein
MPALPMRTGCGGTGKRGAAVEHVLAVGWREERAGWAVGVDVLDVRAGIGEGVGDAHGGVGRWCC